MARALDLPKETSMDKVRPAGFHTNLLVSGAVILVMVTVSIYSGSACRTV
jgi:hypothetical protein